MQVIVVEAETVEKAIEKGLNRLGHDRENTEIKILQQEQPGLFGQNARDARVRLAAEGPDLEVVLKQKLDGLLEMLDLGDYEREIEVGESNYRVMIESEENYEKLIGPNGKTLNALQYLVEQQLNEVAKEPVEVIIDSGSFREERKRELERKARYHAQQVKETGENVELEPMIEPEREVIHQTVEDTDGVKSKNIGEGFRRRVELSPRGGE